MLFTQIALSLASGAVAVGARSLPSTTNSADIIIPTPTYLFTAHLNLAKPLDPIPLVEGGVVIVEPLINGTINGHTLNGTIHGGLVGAVVAVNNTITGKKPVQIPSIYVYGETSDGLPFYVQETGIGPPSGQNTRLQVAVAGKYKSLQSEFIIGQPVPSKDRTKVTVHCFGIPLAARVEYFRLRNTSVNAGSASLVEDVTLAWSLTQTAYNSRYIDLFWTDYLPGGRAFNIDASRLSNGAWVTIAMDLYPTDKSLQLAMQGVALRGLGARDGDESLNKKGFEAYTKCLREFNSALRDPNRLRQDSLLCTARLLALFEMHYGVNDHGRSRSWYAHANGQLAILAARQPKDFRSGQSHQLFVDYRYILIIAALGQRKRFALNSNGWRTIPWKSHRKTPQDKLIDILGDLSGVLEDIDSLSKYENDAHKPAAQQSISRSCWSLDHQLQNWVSDMGSLKDFRITGDDGGPKNSEDFASANLTILYWTTCVLLYTHLQAFIDPETDIPPRVNPYKYAQEIALALPFFFKPSAGIMGPKMAAFPFGSVMQMLAGTETRPSEGRKVLADIFKSQDKSGAVTKFLMQLQRGGRSGMGEGKGDGCEGFEDRAKSWVNLPNT
ncbi:hypothetical protein FSARC_10888 [Fusarium sarcochroum]|uniref:Uncharacterized protein n=1 Tax=Fusarium sarcochroum TaxID=1208366 RepID=A0A8H4X2K0_9HYPO|nr:hypothetical protein FSARC_10888 [Fusarium sarcochroum]